MMDDDDDDELFVFPTSRAASMPYPDATSHSCKTRQEDVQKQVAKDQNKEASHHSRGFWDGPLHLGYQFDWVMAMNGVCAV